MAPEMSIEIANTIFKNQIIANKCNSILDKIIKIIKAKNIDENILI